MSVSTAALILLIVFVAGMTTGYMLTMRSSMDEMAILLLEKEEGRGQEGRK